MTALKTPIADFIEFMLHEILLAVKKDKAICLKSNTIQSTKISKDFYID